MLSTESFFMTCKMVGLTLDDLEMMTIGECLDYVENYVNIKHGKQEDRVRKATQDDFDSF
ncbi:hypothetical protein AXY_02210 [Amphibacillus xylanus NBRC 15112]|uniref:Uncharacterized protein n=1 Tax=Amphibacillus xylanus (strain ATCC 51415 / DSM 6626 / JCM 7361 / LMG 17667 / NBRC 15112 / Ep01) TaxID=698758 RepID=K0J5V2_AMPXN|nr:hypothetical protein AXY_02210 [Amphibacillus xylanus NBRC 15112]